MCPPLPPTSENSQNPPYYVMYPPPPHMWYMHPPSNVESHTSGSSQNSQIYSVDEYVQIGETITVECLERFVSGVCTIFGNEYLRRPNNEDTE